MQPFIKWVGGKRQLLDKIKESLPDSYNHYYEPFIGGGAVLFGIAPENATINDINTELIHTYKTIKQYPYELLEQITKLDSENCDKNLYLQNRNRYNQKITNKEYDIELAALFIWINKHCFNGVYRVNSKGLFNVPYNGAGNIQTVHSENLLEISNYLQKVNILNQDFESIFESTQKGDFIFFDSPYDNSFTDYSKSGFDKEDHERLAELFKRLHAKGCYCMLTNHNTDLIRELYKDFFIEEINVKRFINRNGDGRQGVEIIIKNY